MLLLVGPLLFVLLFYVVRARKAGLSGAKVALIVVAGSACIFILMFGILAWGFRDFG